jgi:hypothetical protein
LPQKSPTFPEFQDRPHSQNYISKKGKDGLKGILIAEKFFKYGKIDQKLSYPRKNLAIHLNIFNIKQEARTWRKRWK